MAIVLATSRFGGLELRRSPAMAGDSLAWRVKTYLQWTGWLQQPGTQDEVRGTSVDSDLQLQTFLRFPSSFGEDF